MRGMTITEPASLTDRLPAALLDRLARVTGDEKHRAAAHSTLDTLWVLHDRVLRPEVGDRFLLSKGHGPASYYAVLAACGLMPDDLLDDLAGFDSPLGHHPDRVLIPVVEISSGSLGHGLPIAVGLARGLDIIGAPGRVFVLIGDAELDEGSNHEAIAVAGRLALGRLQGIVIDNASASLGWPGGIARRFTGEGWDAAEADSHDHAALAAALEARGPAPRVTVVRTAAKGS
ncbi:transketolase [Microbacterium arborescens]|nr:transketolase [Microbacterium arborescens]